MCSSAFGPGAPLPLTVQTGLPSRSVALTRPLQRVATLSQSDTGWATDVQLRVRCLRQLHEALMRHREELRELVVAEVGVPVLLTQGGSRRRRGVVR